MNSSPTADPQECDKLGEQGHERAHKCSENSQGPTWHQFNSAHRRRIKICLRPTRFPVDNAERDAALLPAAMYHCVLNAQNMGKEIKEGVSYCSWSQWEILTGILLLLPLVTF